MSIDARELDGLSDALARAKAGLSAFAKAFLAKADVRIGARAVGSYMVNRSPGGSKLGIRSGRLAKSLTTRGRGRASGNRDAISQIEVARGIATLIKGTRVEYAGAHEYGFKGIVSVGQHTRQGRTVRAHRRNMRIAQRAFLEPAVQHELPALQRMAEEDLVKHFAEALR